MTQKSSRGLAVLAYASLLIMGIGTFLEGPKGIPAGIAGAILALSVMGVAFIGRHKAGLHEGMPVASETSRTLSRLAALSIIVAAGIISYAYSGRLGDRSGDFSGAAVVLLLIGGVIFSAALRADR